jgi:hypothetical protein
MKRLILVFVFLSLIHLAAQSQTITVTSPNGGENWVLGSRHPITWTSSGVTGVVRILLFKGTVSMGIIQDNVPVAAGSFSWVVGDYQGGTALPGTDYKVRIRKMQTEILDASNREFTISAAAPPGLITVSNPNGGETWLLKIPGVNGATVNWTSSNISGNVTLTLKKGGSPLRSQTASNTGSAVFSFAGMPDGEDYRMRIENADHTIADESNGNFTIKKETLTPRVTGPVELALAIRDFKLNNGAETAGSPVVTMDHVALGNPTYYRWRNEARPDWGPWVRYVDNHPKANIPETLGSHTIHFQVKNNGGESGIVEDTIRYEAYREVKISGAEARKYCGPDWTFSIPRRDCIDLYVSSCAGIESSPTGDLSCSLFKVQLPEVPVGYVAEFMIFAGRFLKEGWTFVSSEWRFMYKDWATEAFIETSGKEYGYEIMMAPTPGQRGIAHNLKLWIAGGQRGFAKLHLFSLTLRGPCDQDVSEAFK